MPSYADASKYRGDVLPSNVHAHVTGRPTWRDRVIGQARLLVVVPLLVVVGVGVLILNGDLALDSLVGAVRMIGHMVLTTVENWLSMRSRTPAGLTQGGEVSPNLVPQVVGGLVTLVMLLLVFRFVKNR